jgi:hypothetical protein
MTDDSNCDQYDSSSKECSMNNSNNHNIYDTMWDLRDTQKGPVYDYRYERATKKRKQRNVSDVLWASLYLTFVVAFLYFVIK